MLFHSYVSLTLKIRARSPNLITSLGPPNDASVPTVVKIGLLVHKIECRKKS